VRGDCISETLNFADRYFADRYFADHFHARH
jgi:hypothetical protein